MQRRRDHKHSKKVRRRAFKNVFSSSETLGAPNEIKQMPRNGMTPRS